MLSIRVVHESIGPLGFGIQTGTDAVTNVRPSWVPE